MNLIPMPATREAWLDLRKGYVGASSVAALFGCQADYQDSLYALWHIKAGLAPERDVSGPRRTWPLADWIVDDVRQIRRAHSASIRAENAIAASLLRLAA